MLERKKIPSIILSQVDADCVFLRLSPCTASLILLCRSLNSVQLTARPTTPLPSPSLPLPILLTGCIKRRQRFVFNPIPGVLTMIARPENAARIYTLALELYQVDIAQPSTHNTATLIVLFVCRHVSFNRTLARL